MAIQEKTLDLAIIELNRCLKALKKLRDRRTHTKSLKEEFKDIEDQRAKMGEGETIPISNVVARHTIKLAIAYGEAAVKEHAAALRASMDATRILADLRQGR